MHALRNLLDARKDVGEPPPGFAGQTPALLADYEGLLLGAPLTLEQFEAKREKLGSALVAIPIWFELNDKILIDRELIREINSSENLTGEQQTLFGQAQDQLATAWDKLWRATGIDELEELKASTSSLESAHQTLIQLLGRLKGAGTPAESLASIMNGRIAGVSAGDSDSYRAMKEMLLKAPADDAARQEFYAAARNRWDLALALIAFAIALLTGLNTYYFDKPFGSLQDYVGLFLWGAGTKVAVDTMSAALQWLFSGGLAQRMSAWTR
ncbi:MAG: hypothetical protein H7Y30_13845 [Pyrinomonadaceae bacterium]|nr:hypothetical protein [Pyrinomonadaceae bacterium]